MARRTITAACTVVDEAPAPIFVGRGDGSVDYYTSPDAACFGKPLMTLYGHGKAVTGIAAPTPEEVFTCSMDGTVRQWSTESEREATKRCLRVSKFPTPLRCLVTSEGSIYTGGDDGCIHVIEGSRFSSWSGHNDVLSCIAVSGPESELLITGGYDNHIRVWDTRLGKTIRLLVGHQNHVKCLRVASAGELLFSFGRDLCMKIWRLPEIGDETEVVLSPTSGDANRHATVSFRELKSGQGDSVNDDVEEELKEEETRDENDRSAIDVYHAAAQGATEVKSAIKTRPEPPIRQSHPVGTIEIPVAPHVVSATREEAAYCYIGASEGYVLGINVRALSRTVLQFLNRNTKAVRLDTTETRKTLRMSTRAISRRCKKNIQQKQRELLRAAKKTHAAKKAEKRKELAAARAAAQAERSAARAEMDEEDEEDEDEEGLEEDANDSQQEEEEEEEDEEEDPLSLLDDSQREELAAFRQAQEKERNEEIESLRKAAAERSKSTRLIAETTYDTARAKFFQLGFTSYKKIGDDAVRALVLVPGGICCAALSDRIKKVDHTPGITYL